MTWLAWRQLRTPAAVAALGVLGVLVALAVTGPHLLNVYDTVVVPCAAHGNCSSVTAHFQGLDAQLRHLCSGLMLLAPVLFGIFLGAPLIARELEAGTYRLAWAQSVTRSRWIATRLTLVALVTAVLVGLLSTAVTWWQRPLDLVNYPPWLSFDQRDVVPIAFAVFAVALGALLGALARRTLIAMVATIVGYAGARYLVSEYVRSNLFVPLRASLPFHLQLTATGTEATIGPPKPNDLVVSNQIVTGTGRVVGQDGEIGPNGNSGVTNVKGNGTAVFTGVGRCPNRIPVSTGPHWHTVPATQAALQRCVDSFHLRQVVAYQPPSKYWPLQWSEAAIFVALAVALGAGCVWWVRRRLP
jgi:hypothetical protein